MVVSTPAVIVVMGVSACGKTTLAKGVAERLGLPFLDGDDFHSRENVAKLSAGIPLRDEDRWPWLDAMGEVIKALSRHSGLVLACSALKRSYRDRLRGYCDTPVLFAHPVVDSETLLDRLSARSGHFMPTGLLDSQLATLEVPETDEHAIVVDGRQAVTDQINQVIAALTAE